MYHIARKTAVGLMGFVAFAGLVGCGDDAAKTGGPKAVTACAATCGDGEYCSNGACVAPADTCDLVGFDATSEAAFARFAGGQTRMRFVASQLQQKDQTVDDLIYDKLIVEVDQGSFWQDGVPVAGTYDLVGTSEEGSPLFVRGHTYCTELDCAFTYIVKSGSLELTSPGAPGQPFQGFIRGLVLQQVRIDPDDGHLIEFSNGNTWCVGDIRLDTTVPTLPTAAGSCVAEGTGKNIGDNIRNITLTNCLGEEVDLHERCAKTEAVWIIASAGWCGACEAFVPVAAQRANELADKGLDLMVVVGENPAGAAPTLEYCKDYAGAHGLDPRQTYIDNDGKVSWPTLFGAINTYGNGSIGLPYNIVLDGRSMEYKWNSATGGGDLYQVQDELLARPK
ncbi:MAG: hypothetical protein U1F43_25975 [Myxococcota bacterium]